TLSIVIGPSASGVTFQFPSPTIKPLSIGLTLFCFIIHINSLASTLEAFPCLFVSWVFTPSAKIVMYVPAFFCMVSSPASDTVILLVLISSTVRSFEVTLGILSLSFSDDVYMFLASIAKSVLTGSTSLVILSILFIVDYKNKSLTVCY